MYETDYVEILINNAGSDYKSCTKEGEILLKAITAFKNKFPKNVLTILELRKVITSNTKTYLDRDINIWNFHNLQYKRLKKKTEKNTEGWTLDKTAEICGMTRGAIIALLGKIEKVKITTVAKGE